MNSSHLEFVIFTQKKFFDKIFNICVKIKIFHVDINHIMVEVHRKPCGLPRFTLVDIEDFLIFPSKNYEN